MLKKLPLILIPRSLPGDELVRFVYFIIDNKFPFAKLVVEHYDEAELIISEQERYIRLVAVKEYIKNNYAHAPRQRDPYGSAPTQPT
jgi:hypothetical protein